MAERHDTMVANARKIKMSADERSEQRIDLEHGNLPEEMISSSRELMRWTDEVMRSKGGWDGDIATLFPNTATVTAPSSERDGGKRK